MRRPTDGSLAAATLRANGAIIEPMSEPSRRDVDTADAERLVAAGEVHVVDVRSPEEYRDLGHVPGAILLPVDLIVSGAATLPRDGRPLLVHCEHGVRSVYACDLLAQAGFEGLLNMLGGLSLWSGPREYGPERPTISGPSSWLLANADLLPPARGRALDVACGRGRHALLLAAAGFEVRAMDRDEAALESLDATARRLGLPVAVERIDLEAGEPDLGDGAYALVTVFLYLHRPLFPALTRAVAPGGLLLYETFTVDQAALGRPTNPAFLLEHGELPRRVAPLHLLRERDGLFDGVHVAGVAARAEAS
jgi:rhodanese-related sulfurtransferase